MSKKIYRNFDLSLQPSVAIRQAVEDLEKIEAMPEIYRINMDNWHIPLSHAYENLGDAGQADERCLVCFAGATIAQRDDARPDEALVPEDFARPHRRMLYFLDGMRGRIQRHRYVGYPDFYLEEVCESHRGDLVPTEELLEITHDFFEVPDYNDDPEKFKAAMRHNADILEQHGF